MYMPKRSIYRRMYLCVCMYVYMHYVCMHVCMCPKVIWMQGLDDCEVYINEINNKDNCQNNTLPFSILIFTTHLSYLHVL